MKSNYSRCDQDATIDFETNDRNGWAQKKSLKEMKQDIANTHVSFPVFGGTYSTTYQGYAFVPVVPHPGVVHFTIKNNWTDQAQDIGKKVGETWPLLSVNVLLIIIVGFCIWAVVSSYSSVSFFMPLTSYLVSSNSIDDNLAVATTTTSLTNLDFKLRS